MKKTQAMRYHAPHLLWRIAAGALASLLLIVVAGLGYTAARRTQLTQTPTAVAVAGAKEMPVTDVHRTRYGVLSAAQALDDSSAVSGYVIITQVQGYKSIIRVRSTFNRTGDTLAGIEIISQGETEYLGERITTESFGAEFQGRQMPIKLWTSAVKGSPIDGLSGATVSAKAVVDAVNHAHNYLMAMKETGL